MTRGWKTAIGSKEDKLIKGDRKPVTGIIGAFHGTE
jgi:hypothetical protein